MDKKLSTNPNINIQDIHNKKLKNNKIINFPLKNILFEQKNAKNQKNMIKFKKIKSNFINLNYQNSSPRCIGMNNLINSNNKILFTKQLNNEKRSNSEYFVKPIKSEMIIHRNNDVNENYLRGFSLNLQKFEIQNKNTNIIKKRKAKIRNRAINIFNDKESVVVKTPNRNLSFSFANKKAINNNNKILLDSETDYDIKEENKKLKKEIYLLKKETETIRFFCYNLKEKMNQLEEQNDILKKENKIILKLLNNKK